MAVARPSTLGWPLVAADSHRLATLGWETGGYVPIGEIRLRTAGADGGWVTEGGDGGWRTAGADGGWVTE